MQKHGDLFKKKKGKLAFVMSIFCKIKIGSENQQKNFTRKTLNYLIGWFLAKQDIIFFWCRKHKAYKKTFLVSAPAIIDENSTQGSHI